MCKMAQYTVDLLYDLTYQGEQCWYPVGAIEVAISEARLQELWRRHGLATSYGLETHMLSPAEVQARVPMIDPGVLKGGLHIPGDGDAKAWKAAGALAHQAMAGSGVEFYGDTMALDIELQGGRVAAVVTDKGRIACEQVLLCTNIWGSVLADKVGVTLPMLACAHHYALTEPLPELAGETAWIAQPCVRHQDRSMYFRQWEQAYCTGSYRHEPRLVSPYAVGKNAYHIWRDDDFAVAIEDAVHLYPALRGRHYVTKVNGMFVFSVDGFPIMGPSQVPGFWTAIGIWVTHSGGAGKSIAEWLTYGHTEWDMREMNIARFQRHQLTQRYIELRAGQNYREVYDIIHPLQPMENPRGVRLAPYHRRLEAQEGHFFSAASWEVAQWYEANARLLESYDEQIPPRHGWAAMNWSRIQGAEHLAVRERVGLFNLAGFTKIEVSGAGATAFLNTVAANDIDKPVGKVIYTALLNHQGGIKADLTITRLAENRYWVLTGAGGGPQDLAWLGQHAPSDGSVTIQDVTAQFTAVGLWGPRARQVLQQVSPNDLSNEAFPYFTARALEIDTLPVYALRVSYAGELGWEIYCSSEQGLKLWDLLWAAGQSEGMIAAGGGAFDSLRLEKGYRLWGADIHTEYNPYEAGLGWAVRLEKGDFIGREALQKSQAAGLQRKLCAMTLVEPQAVVLGKEPILAGGEAVGYVTSANYGYSVGQFIVYGYLPIALAEPGTKLDIRYFDQLVQAIVCQEPLYDPVGLKLKAAA
jgi:glycine cleavage system T protein